MLLILLLLLLQQARLVAAVLLVVVVLLWCADGGPKIMVVVVVASIDRLPSRDVGIGARIDIVLSTNSYIGKNLNFTRTSQDWAQSVSTALVPKKHHHHRDPTSLASSQ
jgi:hypothetical protein